MHYLSYACLSSLTILEKLFNSRKHSFCTSNIAVSIFWLGVSLLFCCLFVNWMGISHLDTLYACLFSFLPFSDIRPAQLTLGFQIYIMEGLFAFRTLYVVEFAACYCLCTTHTDWLIRCVTRVVATVCSTLAYVPSHVRTPVAIICFCHLERASWQLKLWALEP